MDKVVDSGSTDAGSIPARDAKGAVVKYSPFNEFCLFVQENGVFACGRGGDAK